MLKIDNIEYDVRYADTSEGSIDKPCCYVDGISETFSLLEGVASQRTQAKTLWFDIIGTEISHTLTIRRAHGSSLQNWEDLWNVLKSPVDFHSVIVPDGVSGSVEYQAHITTGNRTLDYIDALGQNHYSDYQITFIPKSPQIT